MNNKYKIIAAAVAVTALVELGVTYFRHYGVAVLSPQGQVGDKERQLILFALALSLIIVVPVFAMLFGFAWRYRASRPKSVKYSPSWDHNPLLETIWWVIPTILIIVLSIATWRSAHQLDPFKPLASRQKPVNIQVIALDWKWLFIYPGEKIATVNYVKFPEKTPVNFQITADAPMNSFWIPKLGGQIYAMPGMSTQLHLMADGAGNYRGSSANISGKGFADMVFTAQSVSNGDYAQWVKTSQHSNTALNLASYNNLAKASQNNPSATYKLADSNVYDITVEKYMEPITGVSTR